MRDMRMLVLCCWCLCLPGLEVQVLDGRRLADPDARIAEGVVHIGGAAIPVERLAWIAATVDAPAEQPDLAVAQAAVLLRDGGYLPAMDIVRGTSDERLLVTSPLGSFDLPLRAITAWGQRSAVLSAGASVVQDRLLLGNGQELVGTVRGVSGAGLVVATDLAEEALRIPLEQIKLVQLAVDAQEPTGVHLRLVHDPALPPLLLAPERPWHLRGLPAAQLQASLPLPRLVVEGGDRVPLSVLDPVLVEETGAFDVVWHWTRDEQIDGGPITLRGRRYERGIVLHADAHLEWALDGAYERFAADVGIVDSMDFAGDCLVQVLVDGAVQWQERVRGGEPVQEVVLDCDGAQRLAIVVQQGERFDIGDHVAFAGAALVRAGE